MLKTRARFRHKDQTMDPQSDPVGHNNNTKTITTNPLALSLLIGLNNNNNNNKKCISDSDFVRSPKSPLEFMMLSTMALRSPISSLTAHLNCCCGRPAKVGLSIVDDSLRDDRIVFGPALRIKSSEISVKHPKLLPEPKKERSGVVFEIGDSTEPIGLRDRSFSANDCLRKTRVVSRSKLGGEGYFRGVCSDNAFSSEVDDMEDYTCIIAHGANPKTTHIYGDRVLECHVNDDDNNEKHFITEFDSTDHSLTLCNFCNKKLDVGEDIFMYREKAFCSSECRSEEIMIDDEDLEDSSIPLEGYLKKLF